jgi:hypothetical protein
MAYRKARRFRGTLAVASLIKFVLLSKGIEIRRILSRILSWAAI